jgi:hypothetical protein
MVAHALRRPRLNMILKNVFKQIKFQTLVGWTAGYFAGIILNALLGQKWNDKL